MLGRRRTAWSAVCGLLVSAAMGLTGCDLSGIQFGTAGEQAPPACLCASPNVTALTDASYQAETARGVALVEFSAPWCLPCRKQSQVLDRIADRYAGRLRVGVVDVDRHREVAQALGVQKLPTLMLYRDGELVRRMVGLHAEEQLEAAVQGALIPR